MAQIETIEDEVVPTFDELGIGQVVWSLIAQGIHTDKFLPNAPLAGTSTPPTRSAARTSSPASSYSVYRTSSPSRRASTCPWPSPPSAWVLQNCNVSIATIGESRLEQVAENVKDASVKLDHEVLKQIDEIPAARP